jgi:hypothetical protein
MRPAPIRQEEQQTRPLHSKSGIATRSLASTICCENKTSADDPHLTSPWSGGDWIFIRAWLGRRPMNNSPEEQRASKFVENFNAGAEFRPASSQTILLSLQGDCYGLCVCNSANRQFFRFSTWLQASRRCERGSVFSGKGPQNYIACLRSAMPCHLKLRQDSFRADVYVA